MARADDLIRHFEPRLHHRNRGTDFFVRIMQYVHLDPDKKLSDSFPFDIKKVPLESVGDIRWLANLIEDRNLMETIDYYLMNEKPSA
jgi:hypothetical protein